MKELKTLIVNGNEYTVTDPNAARINDDSVGQAAWSSKNIVDRLCPTFAESGRTAICEPVEGYPLEVVSHIRPVQAGSGNPSPENVRPITGHTQVKLSLTNDTQAREFSMDLGQTVYGGRLNWQTGVLTVNRGMVEMDGSTDENWRLLSSHSDGPGFFYHYLDNVAKENLICDRLRTNTAGVWYGSDNAIYAWLGELRVFVKDIELSVEAFRAWLSENPLHICYQLENPITVQLTAQEILALSGTNTLHSDTGDTAVSGKADPTAVLEKLTNAIVALGGNI